jgi:hypothetical protein
MARAAQTSVRIVLRPRKMERKKEPAIPAAPAIQAVRFTRDARRAAWLRASSRERTIASLSASARATRASIEGAGVLIVCVVSRPLPQRGIECGKVAAERLSGLRESARQSLDLSRGGQRHGGRRGDVEEQGRRDAERHVSQERGEDGDQKSGEKHRGHGDTGGGNGDEDRGGAVPPGLLTRLRTENRASRAKRLGERVAKIAQSLAELGLASVPALLVHARLL